MTPTIVWTILFCLYLATAIGTLVTILLDSEVNKNYVVVLAAIAAALVWPITLFLYKKERN